ncbi:unnamed protein product [Heterobilharzia americana]|nr:unnamed protein product [Heterobilharzia americana]
MHSFVDENNNSKQNWSQNSDLSHGSNLSSTTIQSIPVENNQLVDIDATVNVVEQPFKKPRLTNLTSLDSSPSKRGRPSLSNIIPMINNQTVASPLASSSSSYANSSVTVCQEGVAADCGGEQRLTRTVLLDDEEPEEEDDDEEEEDDDDEEEEDEDDAGTVLGDADSESVVSEIISPVLQQEKEARKIEDRKLLALLAHFDEEQLNRFETFRRATFAKAAVRRLVQSVTSSSVSQNVVIAMAGLTKVFIGELVEEALSYKERLGESGPLKPKHIREAHRILSEEGRCCTEAPENPLL